MNLRTYMKIIMYLQHVQTIKTINENYYNISNYFIHYMYTYYNNIQHTHTRRRQRTVNPRHGFRYILLYSAYSHIVYTKRIRTGSAAFRVRFRLVNFTTTTVVLPRNEFCRFIGLSRKRLLGISWAVPVVFRHPYPTHMGCSYWGYTQAIQTFRAQ